LAPLARTSVRSDRDAPALPDHLAHVVGGDVELEQHGAVALGALDPHLVRLLDERAGDVDEQLLDALGHGS